MDANAPRRGGPGRRAVVVAVALALGATAGGLAAPVLRAHRDGGYDGVIAFLEQVIATVPEGSTADIDAAVAAARRAFDEGPWPRMSPEERIELADHQHYGERLLERIRQSAERSGATFVVTTEKDAVKLAGRVGLPLLTVRLAVEVEEPEFFPFVASRIGPRPGAA